MNQTNLKTLDLTVVQKAAEELMTLNGTTTTLEVKNHLRKKGFLAMQTDVSNLMHACWMKNRHDWQFVQSGGHRTYSFKFDTNESFNFYLEKDDSFWAIAASGKTFVTEEGQVGQTGTFEEKSYDTNRKMMWVARSFLELQKEKGFVEATDKRLPLKIRQKFDRFSNQKMTGCKMGFFEAEKWVKQAATFEVNGQQREGYLLLNKSAGYTFSWNLPEDLEAVRLILKSKKWDAAKWGFREAKLLGEKIKAAEAFDAKGVTLKEGVYQLLEKQTAMETQAILVNNENLYQIECFFEAGERAVLSKFQMDLETEMLPLMTNLLSSLN